MRRVLFPVMLVAFALAVAAAAVAAPAAAPTAVLTHVQLRGHLPDLGEKPSLRVFLTAQAYDAFHVTLGEADIFPPASALPVNFDRQVLALYAKGPDSGGRCLNTRGASSVSGDTISLDLVWVPGTCGAPENARYPFVLASLFRTGNDGAVWLGALRTVCAAAPGDAATRACAPVGGVAAPASVPPVATGAAPSAAAPASVAPQPVTSPQLVLPSIDTGIVAGYASALVNSLGWLGLGLIIGVVLTAVYTRARRASRTSSLELTKIGGGESLLAPSPPVETT